MYEVGSLDIFCLILSLMLLSEKVISYQNEILSTGIVETCAVPSLQGPCDYMLKISAFEKTNCLKIQIKNLEDLNLMQPL